MIQWGTTPQQRTVRTTLGELAAVELDSPSTIVVGAVAGLELEWLGSPPLAGWRVVVTRPVGQASALAAGLRREGASVVLLPAITITGPEDGGKALEDAVGRVGEYDWIAFTSANAVEGFLRVIRDARALAGAKLAAVGGATASALYAGHLVADLVSEKTSAAGLVDSIAGPTGGGRILFCRAAEALPTLADGLRSVGWAVDEVETYRTVEPGTEDGVTESAVERARESDAVVFASPSAVRGFESQLAQQFRRPSVVEPFRRPSVAEPFRRPSVAVCIGESTASEARRAGFEFVTVAGDASDEGLVAATVLARSGRLGPDVGSRT